MTDTTTFSTPARTRQAISDIKRRLAEARGEIRRMAESDYSELDIIDAIAAYVTNVVRLRQLEAHQAALPAAIGADVGKIDRRDTLSRAISPPHGPGQGGAGLVTVTGARRGTDTHAATRTPATPATPYPADD